MILNNKNGISFLQFPNLAKFPQLWHGIFLRYGGISPKPYDSLNIGFSVGDDPENVKKNRQIIAKLAGDGQILFFNQVHGDDVLVIKNSSLKIDNQKCDAIITSVPKKYIVIQVADCQPVMAYCPKQKIIANIHSGWKGSIKNIIGKTINIMQKEFNINPSEIYAGIGPSLGPCCGEFINYKKEIPEKYWKYKTGYNHFDFWEISKYQLLKAGVPFDNIYISRVCTRCRSDLFFSYRKERVTGRFAAVIGLR